MPYPTKHIGDTNEPVKLGTLIPRIMRDCGLHYIADMMEENDPRLEDFVTKSIVFDLDNIERITNRVHEEELDDALANQSQAYFEELLEECDADLALLHDHHGDDRVFDETHPNGSYARTR